MVNIKRVNIKNAKLRENLGISLESIIERCKK